MEFSGSIDLKGMPEGWLGKVRKDAHEKYARVTPCRERKQSAAEHAQSEKGDRPEGSHRTPQQHSDERAESDHRGHQSHPRLALLEHRFRENGHEYPGSANADMTDAIEEGEESGSAMIQ